MSAAEIVHDAEHYVLRDQHRERWDSEDSALDARLKELRDQHGAPPNIIHIMWDDMAFGDAGIPAINALRGFDTPSCNRMAEEGMLFGRMYTEPSCTPSRAAVMTGRHPVRNGMHTVAFPIENSGLPGDEVTSAEVLSDAGYATAFYGKWHLGDIEESYPHNQGFDETLFVPYNQVLILYNRLGETANAVIGARPETMPDDPYKLDETFVPEGWLMAMEGKKGEQGREFGDREAKDWDVLEDECKKRTLDFIRANAKAEKPFYAAYWPNEVLSGAPIADRKTPARSVLAERFQHGVDEFIGQVMDELVELGIAENTILVCHADNGPMIHDPPPGFGQSEIMFRGGKSDYWEGGVRVPAFAWWPGTIEPGQVVGDMIHETDLFTTFARLAGATEHVPTDRIIDGIDQTSLLLNGDSYSRRDYNFVYTGPILAATIKDRHKRIWVGEHLGLVGAAFYDLYTDPREMFPQLIPLLHTSSAFTKMRKRHEIWKQKYPDRQAARGIPFTGLEDPRPETAQLAQPPVDLSELPFDPLEYIDHELPWDGHDPPGG
ncbi:MAG: sulfatase-like hydrolase/transferase [Gaiellaceae bacterium]